MEWNELGKDWVAIALLLLIVFGIGARFYALDSALMQRDAPINMIAGIKLNHDNPYDARLWNYEHPPIGKWLMGLPTRFIQADYQDTLTLGCCPEPNSGWTANVYVLSYLAYGGLKETYYWMRLMTSLAGALTVLLVYLISKKCFGWKAGLWSAALVAISFDFIVLSRIQFGDPFMVLFYLCTLYAYMQYLTSQNKMQWVWFLGALVSFVITLGSRAGQPLTLIPILLACQWYFKKENFLEKISTIAIFLLWGYAAYSVLYSGQAQQYQTQLWGPELQQNLVQFTGPKLLETIVVRNSYFFLAAIGLVLFYAANRLMKSKSVSEEEKKLSDFLKEPKSLDQVKQWLGVSSKEALGSLNEIAAKKSKKGSETFFESAKTSPKTISLDLDLVIALAKSRSVWIVPFISLMVLLAFYCFTSLGSTPRYVVLWFAPFAILAGKPLKDFSGKKTIAVALIVLAAINAVQLVQYAPYYTQYANFGVSGFNVVDYNSDYDNLPQTQETLDYLKSMGNPPIVTNETNLLIFYPGSAEAIPPRDARYSTSKYCGPTIQSFLQGKRVVLYAKNWPSESETENQYYCPILQMIGLEKEKEIGNASEKHFTVFKTK